MLEFQHAIVRKPGPNFGEGLNSAQLGHPDLEATITQHKDYVFTLMQCGVFPEIMDAEPGFPDACFVEDMAIITENGAFICKSGQNSRIGENAAIQSFLGRMMPVQAYDGPGMIEGGDVLRVGNHFYIGLSNRTDLEGAKSLIEWLKRQNFSATTLKVEFGIHLKSGLSSPTEDHLLCVQAYRNSPELSSFEILSVPKKEGYAANCLNINGTLLVAEGYPKTLEILDSLRMPIETLNMSEFQKMDGALSCLSLLMF